jgi:hypothetical protein
MFVLTEAAYPCRPGLDTGSMVPRESPVLLSRKNGSRVKPVLSDAQAASKGRG